VHFSRSAPLDCIKDQAFPSNLEMSRPLHNLGHMKRDVNEITGQIIGAAIEVHRELGPGMLESTYEACLTFELVERGLRFERQKALPVDSMSSVRSVFDVSSGCADG
jgi:hypothetical protein